MSRITELLKGKHYEVWVEAGKDPVTGVRKRIVRRIKGSIRDARKLCAELEYQVEKGTYLKPENTTMNEYMKHWLATHKGNIAPSTFDGYERIITGHIIPAMGQVLLFKLQPAKLQSYYTQKLTAGLSARTVQQHHSVLRKALNHAVQWGLIAKNPAHNTEPPNPQRATVRYINPDQIDSFVERVTSHRDGNLIACAVYTGMRQGELLALTWKNVDLDQGKARVTQTVGHIRGEFIFRQKAKSKRSRREVALDNKALAALRAQKKLVVSERLRESDYTDMDLVFPNEHGGPLNPTLLCRRFKRLVANTKHDITFHSLRHTHATYLLSIGINPGIVQDRLGIETIGILMDTYSHVTNKMQEDVVRRMNEQTRARKNGNY